MEIGDGGVDGQDGGEDGQDGGEDGQDGGEDGPDFEKLSGKTDYCQTIKDATT